jgi:nicotinamidase-related amidase
MMTQPSSSSAQTLLPARGRSALLIVDIQQRLLPVMPQEGAAVLRNAQILAETAVELGLPVRFSEQYPRGLGPTAAQLKAVLPADVAAFEKVVFSCCAAPGFQPVLDGLGDRDIILCGIETHVCVLQTAIDLLAAGRRVFVAADATCSRAPLNWKLALRLMRQAGAVIGSTEIFVFSLLGSAGSEQFKRISKLVK